MEPRRPAKWPVLVVRALVWIAVAVLAYPVATAPAPEQPQPVRGSVTHTTNFDLKRSAAEGDNTLNDARADTAPKQQVVNGWHANALLTIISEQQDAMLEMQRALVEQEPAPLPVRDDRPTTLLGFLVLGIAADLVLTSLAALIMLGVHRGTMRKGKQPQPVMGPQPQPTPPPMPFGPSGGQPGGNTSAGQGPEGRWSGPVA